MCFRNAWDPFESVEQHWDTKPSIATEIMSVYMLKVYLSRNVQRVYSLVSGVCVCVWERVLFASDVFALGLSTDSQVLCIKYLSHSNSYALNNSQRTAANASPLQPQTRFNLDNGFKERERERERDYWGKPKTDIKWETYRHCLAKL